MAGRKPREFDEKTIAKIDKLAKAQAKDYLIATALGIPAETFKRHFGERCKEKRADGKAEILQSQMKMAKTNPTMAIWWGKQHLEQKDQQYQTHDGTITHNIVMFNDVKLDDGDRTE